MKRLFNSTLTLNGESLSSLRPGFYSKFHPLIGRNEWPIRISYWKPSQHNLIDPDSPRDIGYFIHGTEKLHWKQVRSFLSKRYDILEEVTKLQSFKVTKVLQSDFLDMRLVPFLLFAWAVVSSRPRTIDITLERGHIGTTQNYPTLLMKRLRL